MDLSYLVRNSFIRLLDVQNELDKIILDFYEIDNKYTLYV